MKKFVRTPKNFLAKMLFNRMVSGNLDVAHIIVNMYLFLHFVLGKESTQSIITRLNRSSYTVIGCKSFRWDFHIRFSRQADIYGKCHKTLLCSSSVRASKCALQSSHMIYSLPDDPRGVSRELSLCSMFYKPYQDYLFFGRPVFRCRDFP